MRLNEDDIEHVLTQKGVEQPKVKDIMTEIKRLEDEEAERAKLQASTRKKKKMVLVASDISMIGLFKWLIMLFGYYK